jgi:type I restriction enzyme S subunit
MKWQEQSLGEISDEVGGTIQTGPFGSQLHQSDYQEEGVPFIMPKDIVDGRIDMLSVARVGEEMAQRLQRHRVSEGTVVMPRRGEVNKRCFITELEAGALCGSGCIKIELRGEVLDSRFLYYYLDQPQVIAWIEQQGIGSTMLNLNSRIIRSIRVRFPAFESQKRVASILSAYDDLIENNRRRMALLEEAARQVYREWFVRLRFPGHEHTPITNGLPEGWRRVLLGEHVTLNYGKGLRADERVDGPFPVYGSSGIVGRHQEALVQGPGIILGRKGNVGSVFWSSKDFYPIDTVYFVDAKNSSLYLFYALAHMHFISTDVAVPGLNRDLAYSCPLVLPSKTILRQFLETVSPMHEQLDKLEEMNTKLKAARDLLLPKLMNGEIEV